MSPLILAFIFFSTIMPIGLIMKLCGKRPIPLDFDKTKNSYWINKMLLTRRIYFIGLASPDSPDSSDLSGFSDAPVAAVDFEILVVLTPLVVATPLVVFTPLVVLTPMVVLTPRTGETLALRQIRRGRSIRKIRKTCTIGQDRPCFPRFPGFF